MYLSAIIWQLPRDSFQFIDFLLYLLKELVRFISWQASFLWRASLIFEMSCSNEQTFEISKFTGLQIAVGTIGIGQESCLKCKVGCLNSLTEALVSDKHAIRCAAINRYGNRYEM